MEQMVISMVWFGLPLAIPHRHLCCTLVVHLPLNHSEIHPFHHCLLHSTRQKQPQLSGVLRKTRAACRLCLRYLPDKRRRSSQLSWDFAPQVQHVETSLLSQLNLPAGSFDLDRASVLFKLNPMTGRRHLED